VSDAVYMDFEEPAGQHRAGGKVEPKKPRTVKGKRKKVKPIPVGRLPQPGALATGDEIRRGVSDRAATATKLWIAGMPLSEIAELMDFESAADVKRVVEATASATLSREEMEMARILMRARAEKLWEQSFAWARADFLVLDDGKQIPNEKKLQWHQQASSDLMNLAILTGAKAPTKVEFTPAEEEIERLVNQIVLRSGPEDIVDAEVIDLHVMPSLERRRQDDEIEGDDDLET
jgi:hypothetical protein